MTCQPATSLAAPLRTPFAGRQIGTGYRVERAIDHGGMGIVLEATHLRLDRTVAVKVLPTELARDPAIVARFHREIDLLANLNHPNIVHIYDRDVTEAGEPFFVMELLEGESLADRLDREIVLEPDETMRIARAIGAALSAAHEHGIVHRDLKPDNVFLVHDPAIAKLLDFGVGRRVGSSSKLTSASMVVGSPAYMAPEQASGASRSASRKADQYAFAAVIYEMLTGRLPLERDTLDAQLAAVQSDPPPLASEIAPWVEPDFDPVLARALAKDPSARYPDIDAFVEALEHAHEAASGAAPPNGAPRGDRSIRSSGIRTRVSTYRYVSDRAAPQPEPDPSEPRLEQRFTARSGTMRGIPHLSPRSVYVLSRLDDSMTLAELEAVVAMPRDELESLLADLIDRGWVMMQSASPAPRRPAESGDFNLRAAR